MSKVCGPSPGPGLACWCPLTSRRNGATVSPFGITYGPQPLEPTYSTSPTRSCTSTDWVRRSPMSIDTVAVGSATPVPAQGAAVVPAVGDWPSKLQAEPNNATRAITYEIEERTAALSTFTRLLKPHQTCGPPSRSFSHRLVMSRGLLG